ncbi:MAG: RNA-binding S4 domain-containing protein [Flavobacteriales bacterium]|jgi:ribosome-associated heat shock protein Hsp15|nr:RNA-binding S4 domain-containing protein [Flavobacteriales bacterium]
MRIDKYIWAVRLAKTRSISSKMCSNENVMLNDQFVKGSKVIKIGNTFSVKANPIWRVYKVLDIPKSRVGAKLVPDLIKEITPQEDLDFLKSIEEHNRLNKYLGIKGRPTKKDRRDINEFLGD